MIALIALVALVALVALSNLVLALDGRLVARSILRGHVELEDYISKAPAMDNREDIKRILHLVGD